MIFESNFQFDEILWMVIVTYEYVHNNYICRYIYVQLRLMDFVVISEVPYGVFLHEFHHFKVRGRPLQEFLA